MSQTQTHVVVVEEQNVADLPVDQDADLLDDVVCSLEVLVRDSRAVSVSRKVVICPVCANVRRPQRLPLLRKRVHADNVAEPDCFAGERVTSEAGDVVDRLERAVVEPSPFLRVPLDLRLHLASQCCFVVRVRESCLWVGAANVVAEV